MRVLLLALLVALAGCLSPAVPEASESRAAAEAAPMPFDFTMAIFDTGFQHERLEMSVGGILRWWNVDARVHAVAADDGRFGASGPIEQHAEWEHRFDDAGEYAYHCPYHPQMRGVVLVR